jgi:probable rRNA maturation factor
LVLNQQNKVAVSLATVRAFVQRLRAALRLGRREFNICFVDDREIERLNAVFLGRRRPTDVLSFPWQEARARERTTGVSNAEFANFLGDVVISAETARRNARREGHSTRNEIRWLILHGLLHLLGYDHERDRGEMTSLELSLRERLGVAGQHKVQRRRARLARQKDRACRSQ